MTNLVLHHGDSFKFVDSNSIDFILTDPPFNISKKTNFASYEKNTIHSYQFDEESGHGWDTYTHAEFLLKLDEWSLEWSRVLRKGGSFAIFCADSYVSHLMDALRRNNLSPRRLITWRKNNAVPVNRRYMPMSANEYVIVGVKEGKDVVFNADVPIANQSIDDRIIEATIIADKVSTVIYSNIKDAILNRSLETTDPVEHLAVISSLVNEVLADSSTEAANKALSIYKSDDQGIKYLQACVPNYVQNPLKVGNRIHPTEKPVPLLQYLVALYSRKGDTVLDGFGGSGSTGEAALTLSRNAIIVEREIKFFADLSSRLTPYAAKTEII